ncbi:conserved hypothetical protein [Sulfolobus islandicus Y.G.57.14]|uniref:Uncharacterized protein n=3 Tax=Saccharolobus islandicus TaxID=43080 RepID=C3MJT7_SACI2|nr:hypothetical protein [Sulfolobus islandicus]ACP36240.1 conserved hypothetical protein [Sulfolobus islandicus L.S.2.15]ACP46468.1 conserved hypothetical protein [Sulfolobus islandicus Y.G.57.14]ACP47826.1 conserved hypothetical protein [Sulfolobus islandicus Y.N.15.51]PVU78018.1 hypothetical protein DDW12_04815 [Sulfolobus islandicus]
MRSKLMFINDIEKLAKRVEESYGGVELDDIIQRLINFYELGFTNINHSSIQLILSAYFKSLGYRVFVEYERKGRLLDLYVSDEDMGIEVEYGYIPNSNAIDAEEYLKSRISLKILRYSTLSSKFYIAVPSFYIPPIPDELIVDIKDKTKLRRILELIGKFHKTNDIMLNDAKLAKINGIISVDVSNLSISIIDISKYKQLKDFYK